MESQARANGAPPAPQRDGSKPRGREMKRGVSYEARKIAHALHTGEDRDKVHVSRSGAFFVFTEPTCIQCGCTG